MSSASFPPYPPSSNHPPKDLGTIKEYSMEGYSMEEQYRSIFENAPDGIFQTDLEGRYLRVNPALAHIYGYASPQDLLAAQPNLAGQLYVDPHRRQEFVTLMLEHQVIKDFESQIYRKDGSIIWISETCRSVKSPNGKVLYYEGFVRDISDRKQAEEERALMAAEREATAAALQQSEAHNRAILAAIPDLMFQVNRDGIYTDYVDTDKMARLLPTTHQPVGTHISERLPAEVAQRHLIHLHRALTTGQTQLYEQEFVLKGKTYHEEVRVVVSGENEALFMIRDISERKQTEMALLQKHQELVVTLEQLQEAKRAAEIANHAKSAFLANMSHELRTPLNGILGYTQVLMRDKNCTPKQLDGIHTIHQCGSHLLTLINDILDLSKIEAQKIELNPEELHLGSFLEDVANICLIRVEQKRLKLIYETLGLLPDAIQVDEKRLRQILLNLLSNAVKFTQEGTITFRVTGVGCRGFQEILPESSGQSETPLPEAAPSPAGSPLAWYRLRFEIIDTGIGIAEDYLEKIFQPFEQVGEYSRRAEGTGLGLTITQKLVGLMGGQLQVESCLGQGSRFWFEVELPGRMGAIATVPFLSSQDIIGYEGPRRRILVVDDRPDNRSVVLGLLEALDFQLTEAEDGVEGIERAIAFSPDLILADLVMPGMDGFEMTRRLRKHPQFQSIPIIASSASVFEFDRQRSQEAGYDDFLPKPIQADELLQKLQIYLELTWIREHTPEEVPEIVESPEHLVLPPTAELETLYEAAQIGHIERIIQEAHRLKSLDAQFTAFANQILTLAEQFDDVAIAQLIETCDRSITGN